MLLLNKADRVEDAGSQKALQKLIWEGGYLASQTDAFKLLGKKPKYSSIYVYVILHILM